MSGGLRRGWVRVTRGRVKQGSVPFGKHLALILGDQGVVGLKVAGQRFGTFNGAGKELADGRNVTASRPPAGTEFFDQLAAIAIRIEDREDRFARADIVIEFGRDVERIV